jgi:hypothetical protein
MGRLERVEIYFRTTGMFMVRRREISVRMSCKSDRRRRRYQKQARANSDQQAAIDSLGYSFTHSFSTQQ